MGLEDFQYAEPWTVTDVMKTCFDDKGYIMVRNFLNEKELEKIKSVFKGNGVIDQYGYGNEDGNNKEARILIWNYPGNDVTGMLARCDKTAGTCEKLLSGEIYHYHTKLMMKEARTGGQFVWHQDYGYWYRNGCLFPDMMTVFIALDKCTKENGCLQILSGSHKCGRIEHHEVAGQIEADLDRVMELHNVCGHLHVEMNPGDALFFHCNLLHRSDANTSPNRRWALLCAYNRKSNDPVYEHLHRPYTPLERVPNSAILDCELLWDSEGKDIITKDRKVKVFKEQAEKDVKALN